MSGSLPSRTPRRRATASSPLVSAKSRVARMPKKTAPVIAALTYSGFMPCKGIAITMATQSIPLSTIAEPRLCVAAPKAASVPEMPSRVKSL